MVKELTHLIQDLKNIALYKQPEIQVRENFMKIEQQQKLEKILHEDLTSLSEVTEEIVLTELQERLNKNEIHTFVGDVLLILNPNKYIDRYGSQVRNKQ